MMRKRLAFFGVLALVFALALPCRSAFALDIWPGGSYWGGVTESGTYGSIVRASNKYDAAVYAIGEDPNTLSDEVKAKLSDPNYGGSFYEYASQFYNVTGFDAVPGFVPTYVVMSFTAMIFTWERVFAVETSTAVRDAAIVDYRRVLAGEDLSGGGASGDGTSYAGSYLPITLNAWGSNSTNYTNYNADNGYFDDGDVVLTGGITKFSPYTRSPYYVSSGRMFVPADVVELANSYISQGFDVIFATSRFVYGTGLYFSTASNGVKQIRGSGLHLVTFGSSPSYYDSDGLFMFGEYSAEGATVTSISSGESYFYMSEVLESPLDVPTAPSPDGDWPESETPTTPDPPEVPTPTAPTVTPDPTPTEPTVIWPTAPIVVNPPEVTVEVTPSGIDYTELLTLINDNLNSLDAYTQAINSCLNSLRADIVGGFDDVVTSLRNVYQYLTHLNDVLEVHCKHIRDSIDQNVYELELYLKSLFEWLPRQLDYDAQFTYDDSAVTSLLYRILNKIPGGSTATPTTYMPNPQADEPGFFDWLLDLWHRFLIDLVSVLPDQLGGLVDAFSQLTHYFPISIPWDIYALLALFEHEPVTPVFDLPWGYGGGEGEIQNVRVDLSCWDSVMAFIRPVFVVGFCIKLALITKDLLSNFDINKGGI